MGKQGSSTENFWDQALQDLLHLLNTTPVGLSSSEAAQRLRLYGSNSFVEESRFAPLLSLLRLIANPLVIILLIASTISLALGDAIGGLIIIAIVLLSVLLNFFMEFQARHAVEEIRKQVATTAAVVRDGREQELPVAELVPEMSSGSMPETWSRRCRLLDGQRLAGARVRPHRGIAAGGESRRRSALGEARLADATTASSWAPPFRRGSAPRSSSAPAKHRFWRIAQRLATRPPETEFGRGIRNFGLMITRVIMLLVLFVLLVNIAFHRPLLESFLFSVALAVGMTPEMMPMIITITLAQGARRMAKKKVPGQATCRNRGFRQPDDPVQR
jgi:Mg2+-importing ATPase